LYSARKGERALNGSGGEKEDEEKTSLEPFPKKTNHTKKPKTESFGNKHDPAKKGLITISKESKRGSEKGGG